MSRNISQVYTDNPSTTLADDDLLYVGKDPYSPADDSAIKWVDMLGEIKGQNLQLFDSLNSASQNLGFGSGLPVTYTESDFPVVLTNPCPNLININCNTPGSYLLTLPPAQGDTAFQLWQGPVVNNIGSEVVNVAASGGGFQPNLLPNTAQKILLTDNSSVSGTWEYVGQVYSVNLMTSDVTVDLQNAYDIGDGTLTIEQGKPFALKKNAGDEGAGFLLPSFTTAEVSALSNFNNSEMVWDSDLDRIVLNANTALSPRVEQVAYLSDISGIISDAAYGCMRLTDNATATTFAAPATPVVVAGTYSSGLLAEFTRSTNTLTYTGTVTRAFNVVVCMSATYNGSSNNTTYFIYHNGSPISADKKEVYIGGVTPALMETTLSTTLELAENHTLQIYVQNEDGTDSLTVQDMTFNVYSIGGVSSGTGLIVVGEDYLDYVGDTLTANPIDLASTNVTGLLPYANIQDVTPARLLGRYDVASGEIQEVKLGTNLSFTGDTLNVAGDATVTLQDAYDNGNDIVMVDSRPMNYSIATENVMLEDWTYANVNPTVPATIQERRWKAEDAGGTTYTGITTRAIYRSKTTNASTYALVDAMYEGGLSDVQYDYRSINSLRQQNEFYRTILLQPDADNSSAGTAAFSSIFDVLSTTKGTRPVPMMTTAEVNAIVSPVDALLAYDTDISRYKFYDGGASAWKTIAANAVDRIGTMLVGTSSYTSGLQASVIDTISGTKTIAANSLEIGQSIELTAIGLTSGIVSGGSGIITCKFGPLTFDSTTMSTALAGVPSLRSWNLTFKVTRVASSSISVSAAGFFEDDSHVVKSMRLYSTPAVQTGFDFTVSNDIDVLYTMTASGGNAFNVVAVNLTIAKYN